jgi:Holliday junction resolvase-like predicted endonuclease
MSSNPPKPINQRISSWHVGVAAEAFAAALFARAGLDVSVQYGADQPEYDLMVAKEDHVLKVSVKGSYNGRWGLTQSLLKSADYHGAAKEWLLRHKLRTIYCLVQFKGVSLTELPRVYLATPAEIAERLRSTAGARGDTILYEDHTWGPRAHAAGTAERIPESWRFSFERISQLLQGA